MSKEGNRSALEKDMRRYEHTTSHRYSWKSSLTVRVTIQQVTLMERITPYLSCIQDRVTDHRVGWTVHGVEGFLEGGGRLAELIGELRALEEAEELARLSQEEAK